MIKLLDKLLHIQKELRAPKGQFNKFGNFAYRSAEDILEAVKPLCHEAETVLTVNDEIINLGDRYYVKATATLYDTKSDDKHSVSAYAREELTKKGMDASQLTGSTASYARKYALNGLFAIDDNKDADTKDNREQKPQEEPKNKPKALKKFTPPTDDQVTEISYLLGNERVEKMLEFYKVNFISEIDQTTVKQLIERELKAEDIDV